MSESSAEQAVTDYTWLATEISRNIESKSTDYDVSTQGLMALVNQHLGKTRKISGQKKAAG